jgi:hypothetical protein
MKRSSKLFVAALATLITLGATAASAQQVVSYDQRFFEKWGDGSGVGSPSVVPCCDITSMNPTPTFDARTAGGNNGPYFAEYPNKTAMVGNLYGFGTPAALSGDGPSWYGGYNASNGGVTIRPGRYATNNTLMLVFPGGNLRRLTVFTDRTLNTMQFAPGNGPGAFSYSAALHVPGQPAFRTTTPCTSPGVPAGCWTPYPAMAGKIFYTAGPNQFGGARSILHQQGSLGVDNGSIPGFANRFNFPVVLGKFFNPITTTGTPPTNGLTKVYREVGSATFAQVTIPSTMATSGNEVFLGKGTGWFTVAPYTTGMVSVVAATIGTSIMDFTFRTETGLNSLMTTTMGGVTGVLQLVSGHLLQSRGGINTNLGGSNLTRITFTPEPASAMLLGVGAIGLIGLVAHDRRRR